MYPYINEYFHEIGIENYGILMVLGILAALICFRIFATKTKMPAETFNFYLLTGILSIGAGLFSAFFFQAIYNLAETGKFELRGMTVMGGILGAAIFFVAFTLVASKTKLGREHKSSFWDAVNLIVPCIVIAQCLGRLGCFTAGCCYGRETDSALGVIFIRGYTSDGAPVYHANPRLPTQLFESAFMLSLFAAMVIVLFVLRKKNVTALMYLYAYPIFRFIIEFFRDDYRGAWFMGMSPSQIQSLGLFCLAITLTVLIYGFGIVPLSGGKLRLAAIANEKQENAISLEQIKPTIIENGNADSLEQSTETSSKQTSAIDIQQQNAKTSTEQEKAADIKQADLDKPFERLHTATVTINATIDTTESDLMQEIALEDAEIDKIASFQIQATVTLPDDMFEDLLNDIDDEL